MIISDIDYLEQVCSISAIHIEGGRKAVAISKFSGDAFGLSSFVSTVIKNKAITGDRGDFANSFVHGISISYGGSASASGSSTSYVG